MRVQLKWQFCAMCISGANQHPKDVRFVSFGGGHMVWFYEPSRKAQFRQSVPSTCFLFMVQCHSFYQCICILASEVGTSIALV